jgi:hypothetical protein
LLDAVSGPFASARDEIAARLAALGDEDPADWGGWRCVEQIADRYEIGDVNLVKPGVGETTRVLLRRVPWKVLVHPSADPCDLAHIRALAAERAVPVEEVPDLAYSCVGLIHPRSTRGATGSGGTAAAAR